MLINTSLYGDINLHRGHEKWVVFVQAKEIYTTLHASPMMWGDVTGEDIMHGSFLHVSIHCTQWMIFSISKFIDLPVMDETYNGDKLMSILYRRCFWRVHQTCNYGVKCIYESLQHLEWKADICKSCASLRNLECASTGGISAFKNIILDKKFAFVPSFRHGYNFG